MLLGLLILYIKSLINAKTIKDISSVNPYPSIPEVKKQIH